MSTARTNQTTDACLNCGEPATGPGLAFADRTICDDPRHAGSTAARLRADQGVSESDVRSLLRRMVERDYDSLRAAARQWKCSAALLSDVLSGRRHPGPKLLRVAGLRRVVTTTYHRAAETPHD